EGTLCFLALLCIIHQPSPPKLLLIEEPERGIHPRRIREVMNFIFRLAEEKDDVQIILTTHNEHVLNDFATIPEAVFVFDKNEDGATEIQNLKRDIIDPSHEKSRELGIEEVDFTSNLGESWIYGLLGGVPAIP
ncbi:MAG: AAA family ATPase, partial [Cytophagaceae bacterium]|nr:AAA family ATPase [Cytophagaceae bacterium]